MVRELTDIVAAAADDPTLAERTWVLITESPEGGWGINGHANTGSDIAEAARSQLAGNSPTSVTMTRLSGPNGVGSSTAATDEVPPIDGKER